MTDEKSIADRIVEWDEAVEDDDSSDQMEDRAKPFDGGIMLAVATVLDAYEANDRDRLRKAMAELRQTAEAVIA